MPALPTLSPWVGLAVLALGVIFVSLGILTLVRARRRQRGWRSYHGKVVASRLSGGHIRFQVAFDHDGREVRFWNRYTSAGGVDPVGRELEVLVNPADPNDAVVSRGATHPLAVGAGFVVFGVLALTVGGYLAR